MVLILLALLPAVFGQCYWNNTHPYHYYGSKTAYNDVRGDIRNITALKDCEVASVWFMVRHGTRFPNAADVHKMKRVAAFKDQIVRIQESVKRTMCEQDVKNLKNWEWNDDLDNNIDGLAPEGYKEVKEFGDRFQEKFSNLLENQNMYFFRATYEERTQKTAEAFVRGLQRMNKTFIIADSLYDDLISRPYRYCRKRELEVFNSTTIADDIRQYRESLEFTKVLAAVRNRTGLDDIDLDSLISFYNLCGYYRSLSSEKRDPWCALFTDDQLEILEYVDDLKHYYGNGYGIKVNVKLGAVGLKDLFQKFKLATKGKGNAVTGYFTHGAMLDMIHAAAGLNKEPSGMTGGERVKERQWRTSKMTPLAATFVVVLHRCKMEYKIQFIVNEKVVNVCGKSLCDWREFKKKFKPFSISNLKFCNVL